MTQRFVSLILVLAVLFFGIPVAPANAVSAGSPLPVGVLTYVEGRVDRNSGTDYYPTIKEEPIAVGDTIRTKSYSRAEVVFNDKSVLRIGENSQVKIKDYALNAEGKRETASLKVDRGKVRVIVSKSTTGANNFSIDTPNSSGSVKGSDICVSYLKSSTSFLTLEGEIAARSVDFPEKPITVPTGTTAYVPYGAPPFGPRPFMKIEKKRFESDTNPAAASPDQVATRKAVLTKFIGPVRVLSGGTNQWHAASVREVLSSGDRIQTGEKGKAEIVLESGRKINLKENTDLKIVKLSRDPKTGTLEDELESALGEIRATIDKKKGGSNFKIRGPVAIAAVRGTILYYFITKASSRSFFEQGNGSLTNLIKNAAMDINAGQNGSVDAKGDSYGPSETTLEEKEQIEKDWEIPDDTYGYTPPEGPDYIPTGDAEQPEGEEETGDGGSLYDDLKLNPEGPIDLLSPIELITPKEAEIFGTWGEEESGGSLYSLNEGGFVWRGEDFGLIMTSGGFPWAAAQAFFIGEGIFFDTTEGGQPLLYNSVITSRVEATETHPGTNGESTSDGGAFWGYTAGLWSGVEGVMAALFVDPDKNIGVLLGASEGTPNSDGTWTGSGVLQPIVLGNDSNIDSVNFSNFIDWGFDPGGSVLRGDFNGDGVISADLYNMGIRFLRNDANVLMPSHDFGIFDFRFVNGYFYDPENEGDWNAVTGGWAGFGLYNPNGQSQFNISDTGYWLAELDGNISGGEIRGDMFGVFITQTHLGVLIGGVTGLYNDYEGSGDLILQSVGTYQSQPLAYFNEFSADLDYFGNYEGDMEAYMGGLQAIDGGQSNVFLLGNFNLESENSHQIWRAEVSSNNVLNETRTTFNGGSYFAFMAGSHHAGSMDGKFAGIYLSDADPEDPHAAGVVTGFMNGEVREEIGMFGMEGELESTQLDSVGISPNNMVEDHIGITAGEGRLHGSYEGEEGPSGGIEGYDYLQTASLIDEDNGYAATWGIYRQVFNESSYYNPENSEAWHGFMGGYDPFGYYVVNNEGFSLEEDSGYWLVDADGTWIDGGLTGHLEGRFLTFTKTGTMDGDIYGLYQDSYYGSGIWTGYGVGTWDGELLDFAAMMGSRGGDFANLGIEGFESFGTLQDSILGGLGDLFGSSHVIAMGRYDIGENNFPALWALEVTSYNVYNDTLRTFGGDAFFGFAGGRWAHGEVAGNARFIYIRNDGNYENEDPFTAGIVSGGLNGSYYEYNSAEGLWSAEGDFTGAQYGDTWYSPYELNEGEGSILYEQDFSASGFTAYTQPGSLFNSINTAEGEFVSIYDENWGIWGGLFGGDFSYNGESPEIHENFRTAFDGIAYDQYGGEGSYPMFFFGNMTGTFDEVADGEGDVDAAVKGVWISEQGTQTNEFVKVGVFTGDAAGNFGTGVENNGLWQVGAVGEFVQVTQLDPSQINLTQIQNFISEYAVGELLTAVMPGTGDFNGGAGSITGNMDMSFFSNQSFQNGIWSAFLNGSFTGMPGEVTSWNSTFSDGNITAQLTGLQWNDGQWLANVTGSTTGNIGFSGQAGGTYTQNQENPSSGNFSGVGVGTWNSQEIGCQECS